MSNIKDRLIEIAKKGIADNAIIEDDCIVEFDCNDFDHACEEIADGIIKNLPDLLSDSEWVKLPCKVGDMVWFIVYSGSFGTDIKIKQRIADDISLNKIGVQIHSVRDNFVYANLWGYVGDTVFLTQAKAEEKLAELRGEKNDR